MMFEACNDGLFRAADRPSGAAARLMGDEGSVYGHILPLFHERGVVLTL